MDSSNDSEDETNRMDEEVVSTAATTSGRSRRGPRKTHPIWDFFSFENGRSRCSICSYQAKGAYTTTLMNHLSSNHRKQHQEEANEKAKDDGDRDHKKRKKSAKQQTINFPVQAASKYAKGSSHKRMIDEHLALFAGCTSFAYHLVECTEFKEFVLALNPRYELPCRETLKRFVARV
uniref:BED-type domain-containing protein n=1 Tax=Plectus sambesii TaxID=2011161 RepID=A0A914XLP2_9BILA